MLIGSQWGLSAAPVEAGRVHLPRWLRQPRQDSRA